MPETTPQPTVVQRTFASTIESLRYGSAGDELDTALRQLVQQCKDTGRAGELKLTIKVRPSKGGPFEIADDITLKLPKPEKTTSLMYATADGHLQRSDPRQADLPGLQVVDKSTGEIFAVNKAA